MALSGSVFVKDVTIRASKSVGVLSALTTTAGSYTVLVYAPQSEELNLSLADSATPTDPEAMIPAQDNPYVIQSTSADVFIYNGGSADVTVRVMAWTR